MMKLMIRIIAAVFLTAVAMVSFYKRYNDEKEASYVEIPASPEL